MAHKVRDIITKLDELDSVAGKIGLQQVQLAVNAVTAPQRYDTFRKRLNQARDHGGVDAAHFVGRKLDEEKLLELLCDPRHQQDTLATIAIVGMGGLGKTTLTRHLIEHEKVDARFNGGKLWICVSKNFDIVRLLNEMLEFVSPNGVVSSNKDVILGKLRGVLSGKRFLIILDDVWSDDHKLWNLLKADLESIGGLLGSMILLTTRSNKVAMKARAEHTHQLEELSQDESWDLFNLKTFGNKTLPDDYSHLEGVGRRIVDKCEGVPLAIEVIGGVLQSKQYLREWESIERSELWLLPENENQMFPSLLLSYEHLPSQSLKRCFAYLALYPRGENLEKNILIAFWSAQGLLEKGERRMLTIEEVGEEYFDILIGNSLLQEVKERNSEEQLYSFTDQLFCNMHDLVYDVAVYVMGKDLFIGESDQWGDGDKRHLLIKVPRETTTSNFLDTKAMKKLQTISVVSGSVPWNVLVLAKNLRMLNMESTGILEVPPAIGELKHLRHLNLSNNPIEVLPDAIGNLYHLITLELWGCKLVAKLPKTLRKLVNLRHIMNTYPMFASRGLAQLTNLHTLPCLALVVNEGWNIDELENLNDLVGEIRIHNVEHVIKEKARNAGLCKKSKVTKLNLQWAKEREETSGDVDDTDVLDALQPHVNIKSLELWNFYGVMFPSWILRMAVSTEGPAGKSTLLSNLTHLRLMNCSRCTTVPTLGQLPALKSLVISGLGVECIGDEFYVDHFNKSLKKSNSNSSTGSLKAFKSLRKLSIIQCPRLRRWTLPRPDLAVAVFPCLESLVIEECDELEALPTLDYESLTHLNLMNIEKMKSLNVIKVGSGLTTLALSGMPLVTSIHLDVTNCLKLQELVLGVDVEYLPTGLQSLVSLKMLYFAGLESTVLPDDLLSGLSSLRNLLFSGCGNRTRIPTTLGACTSLESLTIFECELKDDLPPDISMLQNLSHLSMSFHSADTFKSTIEAAQYLAHLRILKIVGLSNDEEMNAYFTDMTPLLHLKSLKELTLMNGPDISSLPENLVLLTGITSLTLANFPKLEEIPEWIAYLLSLETLHIAGWESLEHLPSKEFWLSLTHFCCLKLDECPNFNKHSQWEDIKNIACIQMDGEDACPNW